MITEDKFTVFFVFQIIVAENSISILLRFGVFYCFFSYLCAVIY